MSGVDEPLFSIVCVYNRRDVLERWLLPSLAEQSTPHELHLIDNRAGEFRSAAAALNAGARQARGKYLLFVHQDVDLLDSNWLARAATLMDGLADLGVAGVVGATGDGESPTLRGLNAITQGVPPNTWRIDNPVVTEPTAVQTLDELLLIVPRSVYARLPFDEVACPHWDLYGADYCLSVQKFRLRAYVLPLTVHHVSPGNVGRYYFRTLRHVLPKHHEQAKWIYTGCGAWNTGVPVAWQRLAHVARSGMNVARHRLGYSTRADR